MPSNRWNPSDALTRIQSDISDAASHSHSASVSTATDGDDLVVTVTGVDPSDVKVSVAGGRLTISAEGGSSTSSSSSEGGASFSSHSSSSSSFNRSFSLPDGVDESDVSTSPAAGGVTVRIQNAAQ